MGESIRWSEDDQVVGGGEGGELNFEFSAIRSLFDDQGFNGLFEGAKIPAIHVLQMENEGRREWSFR